VSNSLNSNLPPSAGPAMLPPAASRRVSGVPPAGERRFVPDQVVAVLQDRLTETQIDRFLRERRLARTPNGVRRLALINARVFRLRITDGAVVPRVVAVLERDPRVVFVQPNYLFGFAQAQEAAAAVPAASTAAADRAAQPAESIQYAIAKLQVARAHKVARGERVLVAVIDSRIDAEHPELAGAIVKQIDVVGDRDARPHLHGTAMAGAIVAKSRLTGIAPEARVVAVRAFTMTTAGSASSTSFDLSDAIDRAAAAGVRIMNLSFAGPADPLIATSLKAARDKGIVLVAAAGNAGPMSPPLYPGADPNVIAVTATDADDNVYQGANRGKYIAVAAPGVDVFGPAPNASYETTTGTSVAAAHVSGVVALLLARKPLLTPHDVRRILTASAHALGGTGGAEDYGSGLADAYQALLTADPDAAEGTVGAGPPTQ
jgi:subtilisin family serine protease